MRNVILGGLITLAVTALVQILIIPWVQRRTRRLERWEDDVIELRSLLSELMPKTMFEFTRALHLAWEETPAGKQIEGARPGVLHSRHPPVEFYDPAAEAFKALRDHQHKLYELRARVALVSRHAPFWAEVTDESYVLEQRISALDPDPWLSVFDLDEGEIEERIDALLAQQTYLAEVVNRLAISMRPPRTYPMRRARRWVVERVRHKKAEPVAETVAAQQIQPSRDVTPPA